MVVVHVLRSLEAFKEFVETGGLGVAEMLVWICGRLEGQQTQPAEVGTTAPTGHLIAAVFLLYGDPTVWALFAVHFYPILGKGLVYHQPKCPPSIPLLHLLHLCWGRCQVLVPDFALFPRLEATGLHSMIDHAAVKAEDKVAGGTLSQGQIRVCDHRLLAQLPGAVSQVCLRV